MHNLLDESAESEGAASSREPLLPVAVAGLMLSVLLFGVLFLL